ncbi:MAG: peptidase M23 [Gammaproteobacteria bacterium]|nr:MAG: peptidase M23 [Gammaproteobacteria bacterium]
MSQAIRISHLHSRRLKRVLQWIGICLFVFGIGGYALLEALHVPPLPRDADESVRMKQPEVTPNLSDKVPVASAQGIKVNLNTAEETQPANSITGLVTEVSGQEDQVVVRRGDSLSSIFSRQGISPAVLDRIMRTGKTTQTLKRIMPGDVIKFRKDSAGILQALEYDLEQFKTLEVYTDSDGGFSTRIIEHPVERKTRVVQGEIQDSLFQATGKAGVPTKIAYQMADIFGWDIDFMRDLRQGDAFFILYEELYKYGKRVGVGSIIAAAFVNRGHLHQAFRFTDDKGYTDYYDETGRTLRKSFLRTPVEYKRISSYFSLKRKHPVLNRIRAHKGVDYAAPSGTPVKATGDGTVVFAGRNGGYGRVIRIQHGQTYTTVYAHLSAFRRGIRKGRHVRQGQIIGYVGMSGLATGPHLHYEFRVNGVHRNPLTVKFPKSRPISSQAMQQFNLISRPLLARIKQWEQSRQLLTAQNTP